MDGWFPTVDAQIVSMPDHLELNYFALQEVFDCPTFEYTRSSSLKEFPRTMPFLRVIIYLKSHFI